MCLDTLGVNGLKNVGVYPCVKASQNQLFSFTNSDQIRHDDYCFYSDPSLVLSLNTTKCNSADNQKWIHTKDGPIVNKKTGLCIDITGMKSYDLAKMEKCDSSKEGQKWKWLNYA
jgi:hypothetical protein